MANTTSGGEDKRTIATILRQYEKLEQIKNKLIKQGLLDGNATPQLVLAKVREIVPPEVFA